MEIRIWILRKKLAGCFFSGFPDDSGCPLRSQPAARAPKNWQPNLATNVIYVSRYEKKTRAASVTIFLLFQRLAPIGHHFRS
jgi:hypothetical protein